MKTKTLTGNSKPGAWIVSPTDKGRKSIKNGRVFLKDGDGFEIELFNPLTSSVLAEIKLNGESISKTGLVVKPGQRVYLDCFIDSRKKFIFSTYEIDGSQESLDATAKNGMLEVFFYKEETITLDNWKSKFDKIIIERHHHYGYPYKTYWCNTPNYNQFTVYSGGTTLGGSLNVTATNGTNSLSIGASNSFYNSTANNFHVNGTLNNTAAINTTETGRIEKGENSSQGFTEVDMDFENHYIASIVIQILPESRKPAEVKNVKISIDLPKGDWTKKQIEEAKEVVQNFLFKEDTGEVQKEMINTIELIKKLADLHSAGILTDEEFSEKKSELLSKI